MAFLPPKNLVPTTKEHVQRSIQANKDHQAALKTYTERLEVELDTLEKLLAAADVNEDNEPDLDVGGYVTVPGSTRATAPVLVNQFLSEDSPFYEDAERRQRYLDFTGYHPMRTKELEDLAEAVRTENYRLSALHAQRRGQFSFSDLESKSSEFLEKNKDHIDWERVADMLSSKSHPHLHIQRTAKECEIRWLGDRHPEFNHSTWQATEIADCRALVAEYPPGKADWAKIAKELGTHRTPLDCMRHGIVRRTHVWTPEFDEKLLDTIKIYGTNNWLIVARAVSPDATAQQCQNRFQRTLDPDLKRGPWSPSEDAQLRLAVQAYGNSWVEVANTVEGRNNEQCRDRWNEKLDPKINLKAWTDEEDEKLLEAVEELGEGKWKAVSQILGNGRKDSACRTRYDALKKKKSKVKAANPDGPSDEDVRLGSPLHDISVEEIPTNAPTPARPKHRPRKRTKNQNQSQSQETSIEGVAEADRDDKPTNTVTRASGPTNSEAVADSHDKDSSTSESTLHKQVSTRELDAALPEHNRPRKRTRSSGALEADGEIVEVSNSRRRRKTRKIQAEDSVNTDIQAAVRPGVRKSGRLRVQ